MMTVHEIEQEDESESHWETINPRAIDAAKWTDGVMRQLVSEIKKRGRKSLNTGKYQITFGKLFDETTNIFDALSGTLKTCKKHGIVSYNGEQLWQGTSNNTVIVLESETHTGIEIRRRTKASVASIQQNAKPGGFDSERKGKEECAKCGKIVFQYDRVGASGRTYHKKCFRCHHCNKVLSQTAYHVSADRQFRCAAHHREYEMQQL